MAKGDSGEFGSPMCELHVPSMTFRKNVNNRVFYSYQHVKSCARKIHLREALIFCFHLKKSAAESHRLLVEAYGEQAPADSTCREWF